METRVEIVRYSGCSASETRGSDAAGHVATRALRASLASSDGEFTIRAAADEDVGDFGIDLILTWPDWAGGYVLVPGAIYGGNRFTVLDAPYPPMYDAPHTNEAILVTDVPRLPVFHLLSGDASYPALGLWSPEQGLARAILFPDATDLGYVGFRVEEGEHGLSARIQFPGVRPERYTMVETHSPSHDRGAAVRGGWSMETRVVVIEAKVDEVDGLFALLDTERHRIVAPGVARALRPLSSVAGLVAEATMTDRWVEEPGFFSTADTDHGIPFQVGWTGGGITSFALGQADDRLAVRRAHRNLDFICESLQGPSGFFLGGYGDGPMNDGFGQLHAEHWVMVRKNGDLLLFLMRQILATERPPELWIVAARRCAEAFVRNGERGDWGQFVDVRDGSVVVGGSACGGTAIAGLVLAAATFDLPHLLRAAERAGERYAARCVIPGLLTGGPGEILNAPDSESAFGLLEGYMTLWEATGAPRWIALARRTARQAASWVVPYDFPFPPDSTFGRLGMGAAGTVIANVQNKHSAPGICTGSALPLVKLARATGERRWLDLAVEISRALPQYVSSTERPIPTDSGELMPAGWVNERVNMSDWEVPKRGLGEIYNGPCWPMPTVLLTALEMPGVYVDLTQGLVAVADHIRARLEGDRLVLTNPTAYDAAVRLLVEADPSRPLGELWWRGADPILIPSGVEVEVSLTESRLLAISERALATSPR